MSRSRSRPIFTSGRRSRRRRLLRAIVLAAVVLVVSLGLLAACDRRPWRHLGEVSPAIAEVRCPSF